MYNSVTNHDCFLLIPSDTKVEHDKSLATNVTIGMSLADFSEAII